MCNDNEQSYKCLRCKRKLTNEKNIKLRYGPTCLKKSKADGSIITSNPGPLKVGDKVIVSSKIGKPVYGFNENNVYTKIGVSDEKWSYPFAVEIIEIFKDGSIHATDVDLIRPEIHNIKLATKEEIKATEKENKKNYEAVTKALRRGEHMGEILGRGEMEADLEY